MTYNIAHECIIIFYGASRCEPSSKRHLQINAERRNMNYVRANKKREGEKERRIFSIGDLKRHSLAPIVPYALHPPEGFRGTGPRIARRLCPSFCSLVPLRLEDPKDN